MKVIINTAVFGNQIPNKMTQVQAVQQLAGLPIDGIQVRSELFNPATMNKELSLIREVCYQNNWKFYLSVAHDFFDASQINGQIFDYLRLAKDYDLDELKFSWGKQPVIDDGLEHSLKEVFCQGMLVELENQPNKYGRLSVIESNFKHLFGHSVRIGYCFDSGNWRWIEEDSMRAFEHLLPQITTFHLKNIINQKNVELSRLGEYNWQLMVSRLPAEIPVVIEYAIPSMNKLLVDINMIREIGVKGVDNK
ncbi:MULTISPECIES: hypothetical protein [unclassified Ligilactobacillus]|uniref:hypothetical protein n=1 Tax=unclassified Ligilactobacillus TaxID=2767920 RepID=UPI0038532A86